MSKEKKSTNPSLHKALLVAVTLDLFVSKDRAIVIIVNWKIHGLFLCKLRGDHAAFCIKCSGLRQKR